MDSDRIAPALSDSGDEEEGEEIYERRNRRFTTENLAGVIKVSYPEREQLLKEFTVICLIVNRMIGTGIFTTTSHVNHNTHNIFITMIFWVCGCVMAIAGILLFMEYGLNTPRYFIDGIKKAMPRSGGELNYLKYVFTKPPFFAVCLFGITFVLTGNVAANSISFGIRVMEAAGQNPMMNPWEVRGIAIVACTAACLLHAYWRTGGIYLNNILAFVKVAILIMIIITGFLAWGNVFPGPERVTDLVGSGQTTSAFGGTAKSGRAYAESFLSIIFAFGGFNQANYVLGEVDNPRKRYKWPAFAAVLGVCFLYIFVNIAWMAVVPREVQLSNDSDVAVVFFQMTYGRLSDGDTARRTVRALMAISSLGNVVVMTFTAARVKQEIAKEGILPLRKFFATSVEVRGVQVSRLWGAEKESFTEWVPFGALLLHFAISVIVILASAAEADPYASYTRLVNLYSYNVDCIFGVFLSGGMLYMRLPWSGRNWRQKSDASPATSIVAATIYGVANLFPVVAMWLPPSQRLLQRRTQGNWYVVPTVSWVVLVFSLLWWVGYFHVIPRIRHPSKILKLIREVDVDNTHGYDIATHEMLTKDWRNIPEKGDIDGEYQHEEVVCIRRNRQFEA